MRTTVFLTLVFGLVCFSCNQNKPSTKSTIGQTENVQQLDSLKDKKEIQNLIRLTLKWADSKSVIDVLPMLPDSQDSVYIGFDMKKHESNLETLRATGFFANEFIENYNQIILTLDKKLRNHEFDEYLVGELPTFEFANDVNPWCGCQEIPYDDNPSPWGNVEIEIIKIDSDKAQLIWKWGGLDSKMDSTWNDFSYKFRTVKENGGWKIAYMEGFDFEKSILKD